jgi:hypothetical protein
MAKFAALDRSRSQLNARINEAMARRDFKRAEMYRQQLAELLRGDADDQDEE